MQAFDLLSQIMYYPKQSVVNNVVVDYVAAQCSQIWTVEIKIRDTELTALVPVQNDCGDGCCRRTSTFRKIDGQWVLIHHDITTDSQCNSVNPNRYCPQNTVNYTECLKNCSQFIYF